MKKLLVCVAALGMLFTSCMRDETRLDEGSIVTFKISAPAVSTRAAIEDTYGTGVAADDLHWAIFEADENGAAVGDAIFENVEEGFFADDALENTFNVRLVKGKSYVGMFWAQANGAPYTVAWPEVTMGEVNSNDEDLDAFFNIHNFSITAGQETGEQKVELRRPFAQLNVAIPATDLAAAKAAGFELAKTGVTLNVAKSLNLVTGKVGTAEDVTYTLANIPSGVTATLEGTEYQLVSFNYVLVDGDAWTTESDEGQELKDVTFNYGTADETLSQTFSNIAIERNHRTYIVGSLLSETVDFRVIILPDWEDPYYLHNQEAGSIEMVAEQTTINKAAMGSATLTWNAVEGAAYYGVEYKGEEVAKVNPDGSTRADEEATAPATVSYTVPEGTVAEATASFTIKAYNENDKVIARVVTEPIAVFSLANRPEPELRVSNGALEMATDFDWTDGYTGDYNEFGNLHENGILVAAEVRFYKDNDTTPAYTAYATSADQSGALKTWRTGFNYKYVKGSNMFMAFKNWQWKEGTGSYGAATATMPEFAKGTYTVDYTAYYIAVLGGVYNNKANDGASDPDRMHFTAALESAVDNDVASLLEKAVARDGKSDLKITKLEGTTPEAVAEGYQGATVTWPAVDGAASYQVFVGATKVADATTNEATVTGLTDTNKYKFIVKSLDANGNVFATSVESNEVTIWNVEGDLLPSPVIDMTQLAAGTLYLDATLDLTGVYKDITVKFTDANGNVAHKAYYSKYTSEGYNMDGQVTGNGENGGRFTYNFFGRYILPGATDGLWIWDDASEASAMPVFEPGEYTITYEATVWPIINAYWSVSGEYDPTKYASKLEAAGGDASQIEATARVHFAKSEYCLKEDIAKTGTFAEKFVVGFKAEAVAAADILNISWNPVAGATYEVFVNSSLVGETTDASYAYEAKALGDYNIEVKVKNTELSATASATVNYLFAAFWTAPTFAFNGSRLIVSALANVDTTNHFAYAYGGQAATESGKSTIKIYNGSELLYVVTNTTAQSTLDAWAGYKRWMLNAQEDRKDWSWTKADGTALMEGEGDVPAGTLAAGTYNIEYTIGYVVTKNSYWSSGDSNNNLPSRDGATRIYFGGGLNDVYGVGGKVATVTKTGTATLTVE